MDIEWLLSTLFDASLLSLSSRRPSAALFLRNIAGNCPKKRAGAAP
jgi:hypothetical protein